MERVVDSVQQIITECRDMLSQVTDCEFVDIRGLSKTLTDDCDLLEKVYESSPGDKRIRMMKQATERCAIRLEFFMCQRLGLYKERKDLRDIAGSLYNDCRDFLLYLNNNLKADKDSTNVDDIVKWAGYTGWALGLYEKSLHLIFELDTEDDSKIKEIVEALKVDKERLHG